MQSRRDWRWRGFRLLASGGWLFPALYTAFISPGVLAAAAVDLSKLPPPTANKTISFDGEIRSILETSCLRCHGPEKPKSGFRLDNRESAIKGGENGVAIIPGNSGGSPLIHFAAHLVEDMEMPPPGKGEKLSPEQIATLRAWIDQGAAWSESGAFEKPKTAFEFTPGARWLTVDGNAARFREQHWIHENSDGGVERFHWEQQVDPRTRFTLDGHGYVGGDDFGVRFELRRETWGALRGGYNQFRSYASDAGGYHAPFGVPPSTLNRDLELDHGRAWVELELTPPHWPRIVAGYEYFFRDGEKATLQWGEVVDSSFDGRRIHPSSKAIDEQIHVFKLDLSYEIAGITLEDSFRAEFYDLRTRRANVDVLFLSDPAPSGMTLHHETYDHFMLANTLRAEKQARDWLLLSAGYYFSDLDGTGGFNQQMFSPSDPTQPPFDGEAAPMILLEQQSHIINANAMAGPWQGLTFTAGIQGDWTHQDGLGRALLLGGFPAPYQSDLDRVSTEESLGLRYTSIPHTVVFADAQFRQDRYDQFEGQNIDDGFDDAGDFTRLTDGHGDSEDVRAGFTLSPWRSVSLHASYRYRSRDTEFNHLQDTDGSEYPGNGYSAFMRSRGSDGDEFEAKLVIRPLPQLKTTFKYQNSQTDYWLETPSVIERFPPNAVIPGRLAESGEMDAQTFSFSATVTPWKRVYISGSLIYSDSRTESSIQDVAGVTPSDGDVFSVIASTSYVLTQSMDIHARYTFSTADFSSESPTQTLALGADYDRHGFLVGLTKRWPKQWTTRLDYAYYQFRDDRSNGFDDYTAHGIFGTVSLRIP